MNGYRKRNKRKRRCDKRDKFKKSPAGIVKTKNYDKIACDEIEEEISELLRVPGAVMWFFDEKGEMKRKIKLET